MNASKRNTQKQNGSESTHLSSKICCYPIDPYNQISRRLAQRKSRLYAAVAGLERKFWGRFFWWQETTNGPRKVRYRMIAFVPAWMPRYSSHYGVQRLSSPRSVASLSTPVGPNRLTLPPNHHQPSIISRQSHRVHERSASHRDMS